MRQWQPGDIIRCKNYHSSSLLSNGRIYSLKCGDIVIIIDTASWERSHTDNDVLTVLTLDGVVVKGYVFDQDELLLAAL